MSFHSKKSFWLTCLTVLALLLNSAVAPLAFAEDQTKAKEAERPLPVVDPFAEKSPDVQVVADQLEYDKNSKKMIAKQNAVITYQDIKITADYAEVQTETKEAVAKGHVVIFQGEAMTAVGEEVYFNFENRTGSFPGGRHFSTPWFITGREINQIRDGVIEIKDAKISTCDLEDTHYEIRAKKATVYKDDKMVAWNVRIVALNKTIFWLPYFVVPLRERDIPFTIAAGKDEEDGYYVETVKGFALTKHLSGKLLNDWRSKRGYGGGAILDYDYGPLLQGNFIGYATHDDNAPDPTPSADNPFAEREGRTRGRFTWKNRTDLDKHTFMVLRYHRVADEYMLQDFFEKEYRSSIEQESFVTFTKNSEHFGILGHMSKRMNDFEALVERLPEIRFDWKNQPFFNENLYYDSQTSLANMAMRFSRSTLNFDVVRADSVHTWYHPLKWKDVKFMPYAGLRGTQYSRQKLNDDARFRFSALYGFDLRTQFYKVYETSTDFLGLDINDIRHVLEPSFSMDSVHPNTVNDESLTHFDPIDRLDARDIFTFGIENRIQTKKIVNGKMKRVDIVSLNTFLQMEPSPDRPGKETGFTDFVQEIVFRPYQWLQYELRGTYNIETSEFKSLNQDIIFRKDKYRLLLGHRYVQNDELFNLGGDLDTSHQFVFEGTYVINPLWEVFGYARWDADQQELEEWQVGARRDLHDFILVLGYNVRNSSIRSTNSEVFFSFAMKNFPTLGLRSGGGRASFSEPRIGETVAGANQYGGNAATFD